MACFSPLSAWQTDCGEVVFVERGNIARSLILPCGQCIGCRLERSRQWAIRCMHEAQLHESSVFITLTYGDDKYTGSSLVYRHFQLFMKRLRKLKRTPVRFFMCGEYGELNERPHFHACLFGVSFNDKVLYRELSSGSKIYTSKELESLWKYGFSSIGDVTFESAAYVARYVVKKVTGRNAAEHYRRFDRFTGEIYDVSPEFCHMSLKPAIGLNWIRLYNSEVFMNNGVVSRGQLMNIPKYYKQYLKNDPRYVDVQEHLDYCAFRGEADSTLDRLEVRRQVTESRLSFKKRSLL